MPVARRRKRSYARRPAYRRRYRRRYARRRPTTRRRVPKKKKVTLTKFMLGQINPFDDRVLGAKIPDANTTPSSTVVANDEWAIAGDGLNTLVGWAFRPWLNSQAVQAVASSGNSWTWPASFADGVGGGNSARYSSIIGNYALARPVANGVRLTCPVAPTSVTGFCHVALYCESMFGATTWTYPTSLGQLNNCIWYKRYPLAMLTQKGLTVVNKITDCTASQYVDLTSDMAANASDLNKMQDGMCAILVILEGVPLSTATQLSAEVITHYEALTKPSGVITPSPAAEFSPQELAGVSRVAATTDAVMFDGGEDRRIHEAVNAIVQGAHNAASYAVNAASDAVSSAAYNFGYGVASSAVNAAGAYFGGGGLPGVTNGRLTYR